MSPRIIHLPLSGGDRKAQAKGLRHAHGLHDGLFRKSQQRRADAERKLREFDAIIREADRMECEAWSALMWAGGPAMPSVGETQANPTIGMALNGGYDLLEVKCNECRSGRSIVGRTRRSGSLSRRCSASPAADRNGASEPTSSA